MGREPTQPLRAVFLDALGTLLELEPPAPKLRRELYARFGVQVTPAAAERSIAAEIAHYRAHMHLGADDRGLARLRLDCAEVVRAELPELAGTDVGAVADALLASLRFVPYPEVRPALAALRGLGLRLLVVSNWDVSLHEALRRSGLAALLDGALSSAEVGAAKPASEIFERALAAAGCPAGQAVHVGDSLEHDVYGARAVGIEAVLVLRGGGVPPSAITAIRGLDELPAFLKPRCPGA